MYRIVYIRSKLHADGIRRDVTFACEVGSLKEIATTAVAIMKDSDSMNEWCKIQRVYEIEGHGYTPTKTADIHSEALALLEEVLNIITRQDAEEIMDHGLTLEEFFRGEPYIIVEEE